MNERITIVSETEVWIKSNDSQQFGLSIQSDKMFIVRTNAEGLVHPYQWDAEGRAAMMDCLACLRDTGSFAALADTSAVPFVGKVVRFGCTNEIGPVAAMDKYTCWIEYEQHMYLRKHCDILPLAPEPPAPKGPQSNLGRLFHVIVAYIGSREPTAFASVDIVGAIEEADAPCGTQL